MTGKQLGLWIWLACLLAGCGSDSAALGGPSSLAPAVPAARLGTVRLARVESGVSVEAQSLDGLTVGHTVTGAGGRFTLYDVPSPGRVIARVPGGPTLSIEVRGQERRWLWLGPVTTMISRYLRAHPDLTLEQASARVRGYLQIPAGVDLSALGEGPNSPFSWSHFVQSAGATPLDEFLDQQVAAVDSSATRSFRRPDPYGAVRELLDPRRASRRLARADIRAQFGELVGDVASSVFSNVVGGGIGLNLTGWVCESLGLNFGTSAELNQIENDLTQIEGELTTISNQLANLTTTVVADASQAAAASNNQTVQQNFQAAQTSLQGAANQIQSSVNALATVIAGVTPLQAVSVPVSAPPAGATQYSQALNQYAGGGSGPLFTNISTLRQLLQGLGSNANAVLLYATLLQQQLGNSAPSPQSLFAEWRTNTNLAKVQDFLDSWRAYQVLALMLVSEWSHLDNVTFPIPNTNPSNAIAASVATAISTLRSLSSDLLVEQQFVPPASIGGAQAPVDDVLVDTTGQTMWYTVMGYDVYMSNPSVEVVTLGNAVGGIFASAQQFSLGPWQAGVWRLPSPQELDRLRQLALTASSDGQTPTQGLQQMGFDLNVAGYPQYDQVTFLCQGPPTGNGASGYNGVTPVGPTVEVGTPPYDSEYVQTVAFGLYLYDMGSGQLSTPPLGDPDAEFPNSENLLDPQTQFNYLLVRSCPGPTAPSAQQEDPDTLLACGLGPALSGSSSGKVQGQYSCSALLMPPAPFLGAGLEDYNEATGESSPAPNTTTTIPYPSGFASSTFQQTLDLTGLVSWSSSNTNAVDVSNLPGQAGNITYHTATPGSVNILASYITGVAAGGQAITPASAPNVVSATFTPSQLPNGANPSAPVLTSMLVTPNNRVYSAATGNPPSASDHYFATGFYSDQTVADLTNAVAWTVTTSGATGTGTAGFSATDPNLIQIPQALGSASLLVRASLANLAATAQAATAFLLQPPVVTTLAPAFGPSAGGTPVRISGSNLTGATSVTFGGRSAQFEIVTAEQITVFGTPPGTPNQEVPVVVTTPAGTATATFAYRS